MSRKKSKAMSKKRLLRLFLSTHKIHLTEREESLSKEILRLNLDTQYDMKKLVDYYQETYKLKHPDIAKYLRLRVRYHMYIAVRDMDVKNIPDWFWTVLSPKETIPHYLVPILRKKAEEVMSTLD